MRCKHTFSNRGLQYSAGPNVSHLPAKKTSPTCGDTSAQKQIFWPVLPNKRTAIDWTAIGWPTKTKFKIPDSEFGPADLMEGWGDCWFISALEAVANNEDGHAIMKKSFRAVKDGYEVTFKGAPNNTVFISWDELQECVKNYDGDADTRLFQLAADRFFSENGNFESLFIAANIRWEQNQAQAEQCLKHYCERHGIHDSMTYNPMRKGTSAVLAFFLLTGMFPDFIEVERGSTIDRDDVMRFLNQYVSDSADGGSVVIGGKECRLGSCFESQELVVFWDVIRTEITRDAELSEPELDFLNTLKKYLETRISFALQALKSAARNLKLENTNPEVFVEVLSENLFHMNQHHFNVLRSAVQEVIGGGPGYIGFPGHHAGTIEGINEEEGTFTYCEPNFPELVHTGELSALIQSAISGDVSLVGLDPATKKDTSGSSEHAGTSAGRRLRQLHNQVVRDGKIDQAESAPLADLLEMDDDTFRQVYDSDQNGVIKGGELKAVQQRVDRWVEHYQINLFHEPH